MRKKIALVVVLVITILSFPMAAQAAKKSSRPYKDVTSKTCTSQEITAIKYIKAHGGYKGLIKKNRLKPNRKITRREFVVMLTNMYGKNRVPVTIDDVLHANGRITANYACSKLTAVAGKLGVNLYWKKVPKAQLTRADASRYIRIFAEFDSALKPR